MATREEKDEAARQDRLADEQLRQAKLRSSEPLSTAESIRAGDIYTQHLRTISDATVLKRIESKELITASELENALNASLEYVHAAVLNQRIFTFESPAGGTYFPAFYAEPESDLDALGSVSQALGNLPAASKYHFFTSRSTLLGSRTPLQAIADGDVEKVLISAHSFAER